MMLVVRNYSSHALSNLYAFAYRKTFNTTEIPKATHSAIAAALFM